MRGAAPHPAGGQPPNLFSYVKARNYGRGALPRTPLEASLQTSFRMLGQELWSRGAVPHSAGGQPPDLFLYVKARDYGRGALPRTPLEANLQTSFRMLRQGLRSWGAAPHPAGGQPPDLFSYVKARVKVAGRCPHSAGGQPPNLFPYVKARVMVAGRCLALRWRPTSRPLL